MRLVVATCTVDYVGRLSAHLPSATRLLMVKADGSVLVHSDGKGHKPLSLFRWGLIGSPFVGAWGGRVLTWNAKRPCWGLVTS